MVDEAWTLPCSPPGRGSSYRLAKAARKRTAGLTVVTQDAADLLATDLGQAVVANAATQILLGQAPQAIDAVASAFALTEGERQRLLAARGRGGAAGRPRRPAGLVRRPGLPSRARPAHHRPH